jgi:hypothetical protein
MATTNKQNSESLSLSGSSSTLTLVQSKRVNVKLDSIELISNEKGGTHLYLYPNGRVIFYDLQKWSSMQGGVVQGRVYTIKSSFFGKTDMRRAVRSVEASLEPSRRVSEKPRRRADDWDSQGLVDSITSAVGGAKDVVRLLGEVHQSQALLNVVSGTISTANTVAEVGSKVTRVMKLILSKLFSILSLILDVISAWTAPCVMSVVRACINFISFVSDISGLLRGRVTEDEFFDARSEWEAQSFEGLLMSLATMMLPKAVFETIKRMSTFTNSKLLDDTSCVHDFLASAMSVVEYAIKLLPLPAGFVEKLSGWFELIPFGNDHKLLEDLRKTHVSWKRDKTLLMSQEFGTSVRSNGVRLAASSKLCEWARRSPRVQSIINDFKTVERALSAYEDAGRVEPACYIFEGPPGVMKSYFVSMLVNALDEPRYIHTVKPTNDGKDFWDMYNNESVVIMDDVGQQDVSQWRMLINLVSPLKYPLDCARAELKDTKFFSSSKLLLTTNNFMGIQGITKADGIGNVKALWRRGYVFKFNVVRVDAPEGVFLQGSIDFFHFDLVQDRFLQGFPACFEQKLPNFPSTFALARGTERSKCILWMSKILAVFDFIKDSQKKASVLSTRDVQLLKEELRQFKVDAGCVFQPQMNSIIYGDSRDFPSPPVYDPVFAAKQRKEQEEKERIACEVKAGWLETYAPYLHRVRNRIANFKAAPGAEFKPQMDQTVFGDERDYTLPPTYNREAEADPVEDVETPIVQAGWLEVLASYISEGFSSLVQSLGEFITMIEPELKVGLLSVVICNIAFVFVCKVTERVVKWHQQGSTTSSVAGFRKEATQPESSLVGAIGKQTFEVKVLAEGREAQCFGLLSGHFIVLNSHCCLAETGFITVYKDREADHRLLDHHRFRRVYFNVFEDVCVLELDVHSMTPFKNLSHMFVNKSLGGDLFLVNRFGNIPMATILNKSQDLPVFYRVKHAGVEYTYDFKPSQVVTYSLEEKGLCGTMLCNSQRGVVGMHSAGSAGLCGASVVWSNTTREAIGSLLAKDKYILDIGVSEKTIDGFSGIKLDKSYYVNIPSKSKIVPSVLFGSFPNNKEPANLTKDGYHTVKTVAKKSFIGAEKVDEDELDFASSVVSVYLPFFKDLTDEQVVNGTELLAGINKKSSNGFGCLVGKEAYIDFPAGKPKDTFREELDLFCTAVQKGEVPLEKCLSTECLKDETRAFRKQGEPRSFRISTIHTQYLTKKFTGALVEQIIASRSFNQIMVGVNPYKEWNQIYSTLERCEGVWAGDIGKWDGKMLPQVQRELNRLILAKYKGRNYEVLGFLLGLIPACPVAVQDDVFLTTHSMPSGNFLTAIYNSIINKFYTAMWYRRVMGPTATATGFFKHVVDYVYGDDKLNGVTNTSLGLNALSMKSFFNSLGMDFTDASKREVTKEFESLSEVSFLKRSFLFHPDLGRVMCPLDTETIYSTMNWVDKSKDELVVLEGKISSYQREMFLHHDIYDEAMALLVSECEKVGVSCIVLPPSYLINLFTFDVDTLATQYGMHEADSK